MYSFYRWLFGSKDLEKKMDDVESLVENEILLLAPPTKDFIDIGVPDDFHRASSFLLVHNSNH